MIQVIERVSAILELVASDKDKNWLMTEIADALGINRSTCANILKSLVDLGYLEKNEKKRGYTLGYKLFQLTGSSDQLSSILKPGFPYVDELSRKFNESVLLSTVRNGKRVLLYEVHANHELQVRAKQESTVYRTTSGVVQLAYFDRQRLDDFIKIAGLPGAEWPGVRTREQMEDAFVKIRRDGILVTLNKNHVVGLAAPLFQNGVVIAAIGIYLPDIRINDRIQASMEASLKKTAAAISALL